MRSALAVAVSFLCGCGLSLTQHARLARVEGTALTVAKAIANELEAADYEHAGDHPSPAELGELARKWRPVNDALGAAQRALDEYEDAIVKARDANDDSLLAPAARKLSDAWVLAKLLLENEGVLMPDLPALLKGLAQ